MVADYKASSAGISLEARVEIYRGSSNNLRGIQRSLQCKIPLSWRQEKSWEFMNLKHIGKISVAQYDAKFTQLIKYVLMYDADEW